MKEAEGIYRIVEYTAGPHSGFQAVVKRIGHTHHPAHFGHKQNIHHYEKGGDRFVGTTLECQIFNQKFKAKD